MAQALATYTREQFEELPAVRVWSAAGPCLSYRRVRVNGGTITVASWNYDHPSSHRVPDFQVHTEPCTRCKDHPRTAYPRGYED